MNATDKLVSIIVPVYNAGNYIEETIRMVEAQTYENWELILIDDCSKDNSRWMIEHYLNNRVSKQPVHLIQKKQNEGAAMARNTGIEASNGRYIAFLDADDIWFPEKLEKEMDFMEEKQAAFVCTSYEFGDEQAKGTGKIVHVPATLAYKQALSRTVIFTTTVMLDTKKTGKELIRMPAVKVKILQPGGKYCGMDSQLMGWMRYWLFTADLQNPYLPINLRQSNGSGIYIVSRNNCLFLAVCIILFFGHFGQHAEEYKR